MVLAPYSNACASLPNEMLPYGMKITGCSPAALAYAAMDAEVFPVETQARRVQTAVLRGPAARQQRCAAFSQCDHAREVVQKGNELAIAPDAALIQRGVRGAAPPPQSFQLIGGLRRLAVHRFQQTAAVRAIVEDFGNRKPRAAPFFDTG